MSTSVEHLRIGLFLFYFAVCNKHYSLRESDFEFALLAFKSESACLSPRCLCVVVDSLSCTDGSISAAAQCWLVRALSLNDGIRILEPILLLLLHPSTQRSSIQSVKQNVTAGKCCVNE